MAKAVKKKKKDIKLSVGIFHVKTSSNNTIVSLTDPQGNKVFGSGTGSAGFKGAKQKTPYAAEQLTRAILKDAQPTGLKEVGIILKGTGIGRDGVFKAINESGMVDIMWIRDETPIQFGGCKRKRPKRN